jgi:hypothetical protein
VVFFACGSELPHSRDFKPGNILVMRRHLTADELRVSAQDKRKMIRGWKLGARVNV